MRAVKEVGDPQKKDEKVEVLSRGPIPEVDMSRAPTVIDGELVTRDAVDVADVAPVVADATARNRQPEGVEQPATPQLYRVEATKQVLDGGARVTLREGKEISPAQYNIRDLQRQGVRLRKIETSDPNAPLD